MNRNDFIKLWFLEKRDFLLEVLNEVKNLSEELENIYDYINIGGEDYNDDYLIQVFDWIEKIAEAWKEK